MTWRRENHSSCYSSYVQSHQHSQNPKFLYNDIVYFWRISLVWKSRVHKGWKLCTLCWYILSSGNLVESSTSAGSFKQGVVLRALLQATQFVISLQKINGHADCQEFIQFRENDCVVLDLQFTLKLIFNERNVLVILLHSLISSSILSNFICK